MVKKDELAAIRKQSVQARARDEEAFGISLLLWLGASGDIISPWWSKQRDRDLRKFWRMVDYISGTIYTMESRLKTMPFNVVPRDLSVKAHMKQADDFTRILMEQSEFGRGWDEFYSPWVEDLVTQDNGAFAEVIGAGKPDGPIKGMAGGLAHLDSWRCQRTSSMEFPVIYNDTDGKRYKMHYTRVVFTSQMPSPAVEMYRVGMCAVSRCINVAQTLLDQLVYKQEKLGSRPHRGLLVTQGGIGPEHVKVAFEMAEEAMDSQLLRRYSKTVVIGSKNAPLGKIQKVDLTSLPDGFDEKTSLTLGMAAIALAFGMDPRELWPALTVGATKAEALISHIKQRGKGIGDVLQTTERLLESKFLPAHLMLEFDFQDDEQDKQVAEIKVLRSSYHVAEFGAGIVDERTVREQMLHDNDLTLPQFIRMELIDGRLEDGTTVLSLFFDPDYTSMLDLGVDDPLDTKANDASVMLDAISAQRNILLGDVVTANKNYKKLVQQGLAALDELELAYGGRSTELTKPKPPGALPEEEIPEGELSITEEEFEDEDLEVKRSWRDRLFRRKKKDTAFQDAADAIKEAADALSSDGHKPQEIHVHVPEMKQGDTIIHVPPPPEITQSDITIHAPPVEVAAPHVEIHIPEQKTPVVNVKAPEVNVTVPEREVKVEIPEREVHVDVKVPETKIPKIDVHVPETPVTVKLEATLHSPDEVIETETMIQRNPISNLIQRTFKRSRKREK